ncbi:hypothetical protein OAQ50_00500 [Acidimicrobiia bacterium]|nr:hypothetical protein [Acidimicrobiia bacterium]
MNEKKTESDDNLVQDLQDSLGDTLDETFEIFNKLLDSIKLSSLNEETKKETINNIESLQNQFQLSTVNVKDINKDRQNKLRTNEEE